MKVAQQSLWMQSRTANRPRNNLARAQAGMTLLELIIVCAILLVLATAAMPMARFTVKRQKEAELRRDLREMRDAIDRYKDASDRNLIRVEAGTEGYPPDMETLVKGVEIVSQAAAGTRWRLGHGSQWAVGFCIDTFWLLLGAYQHGRQCHQSRRVKRTRGQRRRRDQARAILAARPR